jgi:uncharacterized protein (DUF58 family)
MLVKAPSILIGNYLLDRSLVYKAEEETNLRCHIIIDNSSSMHYPKVKINQNFHENKIGFSVLASAVLMNLLKKQRDAIGLSVFQIPMNIMP